MSYVMFFREQHTTYLMLVHEEAQLFRHESWGAEEKDWDPSRLTSAQSSCHVQSSQLFPRKISHRTTGSGSKRYQKTHLYNVIIQLSPFSSRYPLPLAHRFHIFSSRPRTCMVMFWLFCPWLKPLSSQSELCRQLEDPLWNVWFVPKI